MSMTMAEFHTLEGKRRGEAIGERRGALSTSRRNLEIILEARFGEISSDVHEQIARAKLNSLETWIKRAATAETVDEALLN